MASGVGNRCCGRDDCSSEPASLDIGTDLALQVAALAGVPFALARQGVETYELPAFGWLAGWLAGFLVISVLARTLNSEQRRFAQGALGRYSPRDIAAEIIRDPEFR